MVSCSCLVFLLIRSELRAVSRCHHCNVDDQREAGEDKQNKQEKVRDGHTREHYVVPLALPLMAGPGD